MRLEGDANAIYEFEISRDLREWESVAKGHSADGLAQYLHPQYKNTPQLFVRATQFPEFEVQTTTYHGWNDAVILGNGLVEVIVVPSIGRVLQFRRAGESEGPFWINPATEGLPATTNPYRNFGGDKIWSAPQHWGWPPPTGFDRTSYTLQNNRVVLRLTGPLQSESGIRVKREIAVDHFEPRMTITSTFTREQAQTDTEYNDVSIWVVTQLKRSLEALHARVEERWFPQRIYHSG